MLPTSGSTTPRSQLARRKPSKLTNLELNNNPLSPHAFTIQRACIPSWRPMLAEIDVNLRSIKEFFLPLGGENFNIRDCDGRTPLHEAAQMGYEAVVEYLVLRGASIYAQDDEGLTPLALANRFGNTKIIALMLGKGHMAHIQEQDQISDEEVTLSLMSKRMTKKVGIKWAFGLLNVGVELFQALLSQESAYWENKTAWYRWLSVSLPFVCLLLSVSEIVYEAKRDRVEWKKRRGCYWFYYPGRHVKTFGTFMLWFGLLSSIVQLCLSLLTLTIKRGVLKFDYLGLLLSICYLVSRLGCHKMTMRGVIKCGEHGEYEIGGRLEQGRWVFDCFLCRMEKVV